MRVSQGCIFPVSSYMKLKRKFIRKVSIQLVDLHTYLLHGITVTDGHCAVRLRLKVIGYAERSSDLVLTTVSLTDITSVVKLTVILLAKLRVNCLLYTSRCV